MLKCPYCHRLTSLTADRPHCQVCGVFLGELLGLDNPSFPVLSDDDLARLYKKAERKGRKSKKVNQGT